MNKFKHFFKEASVQYEDWTSAIEGNSMLRTGRDLLIEFDRIWPGKESLIVGGTIRDLLLVKFLVTQNNGL